MVNILVIYWLEGWLPLVSTSSDQGSCNKTNKKYTS